GLLRLKARTREHVNAAIERRVVDRIRLGTDGTPRCPRPRRQSVTRADPSVAAGVMRSPFSRF
ncbi:MAG TPA: hypothetical protein VMU89_20365, partial [Thermomicrobiaceae bacterium]|nr:hypothetical protein [Thermomicrobiaceae bacterium]